MRATSCSRSRILSGAAYRVLQYSLAPARRENGESGPSDWIALLTLSVPMYTLTCRLIYMSLCRMYADAVLQSGLLLVILDAARHYSGLH
jgi:hypothetical protein